MRTRPARAHPHARPHVTHRQVVSDEHIVGAGSLQLVHGVEGQKQQKRTMNGIITGHAYSVLQVFRGMPHAPGPRPLTLHHRAVAGGVARLGDHMARARAAEWAAPSTAWQVYDDGAGLRLCELRNPWGRGEWKGDWSDGSGKWDTATGRKTRRALKMIAQSGRFWMAWVSPPHKPASRPGGAARSHPLARTLAPGSPPPAGGVVGVACQTPPTSCGGLRPAAGERRPPHLYCCPCPLPCARCPVSAAPCLPVDSSSSGGLLHLL